MSFVRRPRAVRGSAWWPSSHRPRERRDAPKAEDRASEPQQDCRKPGERTRLIADSRVLRTGHGEARIAGNGGAWRREHGWPGGCSGRLGSGRHGRRVVLRRCPRGAHRKPDRDRRQQQADQPERREAQRERSCERIARATDQGETLAPAAPPKSKGVGHAQPQVPRAGGRPCFANGSLQAEQVRVERAACRARPEGDRQEFGPHRLGDRETVVSTMRAMISHGTAPCGQIAGHAAIGGLGGCAISRSRARRRSSRRSLHSHSPRRRTARWRCAGRR